METLSFNIDIQGQEEVISARQKFRDLRGELLDLAVAGKEGTEEFKRVEKELEDVGTTVQQTRERIKDLTSGGSEGLADLTEAFSEASNIAVGYQGVMNLLGVENEDMIKSMQKLQALQAVSNSLSQISTSLTNRNSVANKALTITQGFLTKAFGASTVAAGIFKVALSAIGIGLIIGAVSLLINHWDTLKKKFYENVDAIKSITNRIIDITAKFMPFMKVIQLVRDNWDELKVVMKDTIETLINGYNKVADFFGLARLEIDKTTGSVKRQQTEIQKAQKALLEVERQIAYARSKGMNTYALEVSKLTIELSMLEKGTTEYYNKQAELNKLTGKLKDNVKDLDDGFNKHKGTIEKVKTEYELFNDVLKKLESEEEGLLFKSLMGTASEEDLQRLEDLRGEILEYQLTKKELEDSKVSLSLFEPEKVKEETKAVEDTRSEYTKLNDELKEQEDILRDLALQQARGIISEEGIALMETTRVKIDGINKELEDTKNIMAGIAEEVVGEENESNMLLDFFGIDKDGNLHEKVLQGLVSGLDMANELISNIFGTRLNNLEANLNKEQELIEQQKEQGLITEEEYNDKLNNATLKFNKKKLAIEKKQFAIDKARKISESIMNTAMSVTQALSTPPGPPFTIPFGIAAGAMGAVQIATIAAQKFQGGSSSSGSGVSSSGGSASANIPQQQPFYGNTALMGIQSPTDMLQHQRVYVVESDITGVQNKVNVLETSNTY